MTVAAVFVIAALSREWHGANRQELNVLPGRLVAATALESALLAAFVALWYVILKFFDGPRPTYRALLQLWWRSTLAKYLPGSVWSLAVATATASDAGGSAVAVGAGFLLQAILSIVGAVSIGCMFAGGSVVGASIAVIAGVVLVHPRILNALVRAGARLGKRPAAVWRGSWLAGAGLLLAHIAIWGAFGFAFALLLSSLTPIAGNAWPALAGINALAFAAGFVAFIAPGGIGVREAAAVALLSPFIPNMTDRIAIAAASRLWLVCAEILTGMTSLALARVPRAVHDAPAQVRARG